MFPDAQHLVEHDEELEHREVSNRHVAGHAEVVRPEGRVVRGEPVVRLGRVVEDVLHERERLGGDGNFTQSDAHRGRQRIHHRHLVARSRVRERVGPTLAVQEPRASRRLPECADLFGAPPYVDEVLGHGERLRGGEGRRGIALDEQLVVREVSGEDGEGEDGAARLGDRDVPPLPRAVEGESKEEPVADAADVWVVDVRACVAGDAGREDDRLEAGAVLGATEARGFVDAAPEAGGVSRLQKLDDPAMLRAHAVAQRRPLLGGARELEGRGEPFERAHGEIEPFVHVNQEGVVRLELLASEAAADGRLRIGDGACALGGRDASKAAVEHEPAADVV